MKIRNILSVLFVGLLFTSCNSEEEVQRGNEDGRDLILYDSYFGRSDSDDESWRGYR